MKVAVLTTSFPLTPDSMSGIFIYRLMAHLPREIQTTILTPSAKKSPAPNTPLFKLKCFRYAPSPWQILAHGPGGINAALKRNKLLYLLLPLFLVSMFSACVRLARKNDLLHANWSINGVIAGLAGKITHTPVITTLRGSDVNNIHASKTYRALLRLCLSLSRYTVTVSEAILQLVASEFPQYANRLIFIPNGVENTFLDIETRNPDGHIRLLYVGSLVPGKGIDQILYALKQLEDLHNVSLSVVGDGPERSALELLTNTLGLSSQVRFHGFVPPHQIETYYQQTDIVILASFSEGRPNMVLEAMAAGLAVIASKIAGVEELINHGQTGILFTPGNVDELAQAIRVLSTDALLRKDLGGAAKNYIVENKLTWEETGHNYAGLYKKAFNSAYSTE